MDRNLYLVVISAELDRQQVIEHLATTPNTGWFYNMPNSFFLKSTLTADQISKQIQHRFGKLRHFVSEVGQNRQGILPKDHWQKFYASSRAVE